MDLTHEDVRKIIGLIDEAKDLDEIEIVYGGFRLHVRRTGNAAVPRAAAEREHPASAAATAGGATLAPPASGTAAQSDPLLADGEIAVRAPMLGTFYRSPSPGEPTFVEVGQRVHADDTVCLIEVMKLFSSIRAGIDGVVTRILADNGALVQFNEVLLVIAASQG